MPIRLYHGRRRAFTSFDQDLSETEYGCFFHTEPHLCTPYARGLHGEIIEVELEAANPYRCTALEWGTGTAPDPRDVADEGVYDAYVIDGLDGDEVWCAWDASKMRIIGTLCRQGDPMFAELARTCAAEMPEEAEEEMSISSPRPR